MAIDLDLRREAATRKYPFSLIDLETATTKKVAVPPNYMVTVSHAGLKSDGSDSAAGDYVVLMHGLDTMAGNKNAGEKVLLFAGGGAVEIHGLDLQADTGETGSPRTINLRAVTNSAKVQIVMRPVIRA